MQDTYPPAPALKLELINVNRPKKQLVITETQHQRVNKLKAFLVPVQLKYSSSGRLTVSFDPILWTSSAMASRQQHPASYHAGETKARAEVTSRAPRAQPACPRVARSTVLALTYSRQ